MIFAPAQADASAQAAQPRVHSQDKMVNQWCRSSLHPFG